MITPTITPLQFEPQPQYISQGRGLTFFQPFSDFERKKAKSKKNIKKKRCGNNGRKRRRDDKARLVG